MKLKIPELLIFLTSMVTPEKSASRKVQLASKIKFLSVLDQPPQFEEHEKFYFISEGSPVGQTVAVLRAGLRPDSLAVSGPSAAVSRQIKYKIASTQYLGEEALFQIDDTGRIIISTHLDRETQPLHKLTVLAETDSSPPLIA